MDATTMPNILPVIVLLLVPAPVPPDGKQPWTKIDTLIAQSLKENGVESNPPVSDEVFLKRIYMEVAGRLPAAGEAREFLDSDEAGSRHALSDKLCEPDGY